ncbi:MAG: response regulator [Nanoarchaeota archaeon]|nr:response regulator [Nanoarchaeota archaeon]
MLKILIVEDEQAVREFLVKTFDMIGYITLAASTGKEALEIFEAQHPQAIFLDLMLPDKDGLEVLKEIKTKDPNNIVIVVSSKTEDKIIKKAKDLGGIEYNTKPFFRESIRSALSNNLYRITAQDGGKPKILIVDDEEEICYALNKYFSRRIEADMVLTFDGEQALDLINKTKFDIVFMDINLPGKDGLAVIEEVKQKNKHTAFITVTGYGSQELIQKARKLGVVDYFKKPVRPEEIFERLKSILIARGKFIVKK